MILANESSSAANASQSAVFKYKFSIMEQTREGLSVRLYNLIAVTAEGKLPVSFRLAALQACFITS